MESRPADPTVDLEPGVVPDPVPGPEAAASSTAPAPPASAGPALRPRRRRRLSLKRIVPAWSISVIVHAAVLMTLAAATVSSQDSLRKVLNIDSALVAAPTGAEPEILNVYADPSDAPRERATGDEHETMAGYPVPGDPGPTEVEGSSLAAVNAGRVSRTPLFKGPGAKGQKAAAETGIGAGSGIAFNRSVLQMNPTAPALDIGLVGRNGIKGDPSFGVTDVGQALDQLAREILRHLKQHRLTVVWLFDESTSMRDDQQAILEKFDRVTTELKLGVEPEKGKKSAPPQTHAILGFGEKLDPIQTKPTPDIDTVTKAIRNLKVDSTGIENTMQAIKTVVDQYSGLVTKDHRVVLVLVTDESGDDGTQIEEAREALRSRRVPLYVIGRQSIFGFPFAHHYYKDPTTSDVYYPVIRRGPESADVEMYQWDGLYDRWDEQPSGFAPFELGRLTRETGGIYFILPSEETMRVRQREKAYSFAQLKEFMPEYENRQVYVDRRNHSPLRRSLQEIVANSKNFYYRREFPVDSQALVQMANEEATKATARLNTLLEIQTRLEQLSKVSEREVHRRWRAHYELMLASTVAFEVKAYEYRALMAKIVNSPPSPAKPPPQGAELLWIVDHNPEPIAPKNETAKKYAEAERLLKQVVATYPKTPWGDLAQDILNRGLSVKLNELARNLKYYERAQYVPKY